MRVLHVAPYASLDYGGPAVALRSMAKVLKSQGAEVDVVTTNAAGNHDLPLREGETYDENGIKFRFFKRHFPRSWFRAPGMSRWLQEHVYDYDLLHLHVPFTSPFRAGALVARAAGRPYIATLHGVLDPWSLKQKAWKKKPYLRILERDVLAGAKILHVTAPLERDFVDVLCFGPEVCCLPLAVPLPLAHLRLHRTPDCRRILSIARLHPVKALPILFAALAQLRAEGCNVYLDLAGHGDAKYVAELHKHAQSLGVAEFIVWHGQVDEVQKEHLYAKADCLALLSYHENFGLAAAEAMAAGIPVVVSDQVGLAHDVLAFHAGSVVPVGDHAAAASALRSFLEPTASVNAGRRGRKLVEQHYGEEAFAKGLMKMYRAGLSSL